MIGLAVQDPVPCGWVLEDRFEFVTMDHSLKAMHGEKRHKDPCIAKRQESSRSTPEPHTIENDPSFHTEQDLLVRPNQHQQCDCQKQNGKECGVEKLTDPISPLIRL